ncbi:MULTISPECIES: helix-turn-helix transcriptional regulator [unclassified Microbacterium]|uniref:helix-turn-helix transcriptional regulator n=1 Tax=unclassified Microbacterium TaxID=2609290 RepID=UPI00109CB1CB|nr:MULTISPECIES: helix-turn-helix transcriptional regulator [unclassified Microbacterium]
MWSHASQITPLGDDEVKQIERQWDQQRALIIAGDRGSGRSALVDELVSLRAGDVAVRRVHSYPDEHTPYATLLALRIVEEGETETSPETIARKLAARMPATTLIIEHAEHVDSATLRVLTALVRVRQDIRLLATIDRSSAALQLSEATVRIARVVLRPFDRSALADVVERACGARPTPLTASALLAWSGGSYRSLIWLLEVAGLHRGVHREHTAVRVDVPPIRDLRVMPDWSIDPALLGERAAQMLALAGDLSLTQLKRLGALEHCAALETSGLIVASDDGTLRLRSPAIGLEVASRLGLAARHTLLTSMLDVLDPVEVEPRQAALLADWCGTSEVSVPVTLRAAAARRYVDLGRHDDGLELHMQGFDEGDPERSRALADIALAAVSTDCSEVAIEVARSISLEDADASAAAWLAVTLGIVAEGPDGRCADAVRDFLAESEPSSCAALVVAAWRRVLDPDPQHPKLDGGALSVATAHRLRMAEAIRAWCDGRPVAARAILASSAASPDFAVDRVVGVFLEFTTHMLAPDLDRALDALVESRDPRSADGMTAILSGALSIYNGGLASAWLDISRVLGDDVDRGRRFSALAHGIASIASSQLGADARAGAEYERILDGEHTSILAGASQHVRGIAATQLNPSRHEEGVDAYRAAAESAKRLQFPLLGAMATYRLADELGEGRRSAMFRALAEMQTTSEPPDGLPGLIADMAAAIESRNVRRMITVFQNLQRAGLVQDSKVLALRLIRDAAKDIPETTRRAAARLSKLDFRRRDDRSGTLTTREREVAALVASGFTDRQIGERLSCSPRTASVHVARILKKLGLPNRRALTVEIAARHGADAS